MTEVKFYLLPEDTQAARWEFACRLSQTIINRQRKLFVQLENEDMCGEMDSYMWTKHDDLFLPHGFAGESYEVEFPIELGHSEEHAAGHFDCMILLDNTIPRTFSRFKTLVEILTSDTETLSQGRSRYRQYQKQGMKIDTIDRRVPV